MTSPSVAAQIERIRAALDHSHGAASRRLNSGSREAAVLVPMFERAGELHVLYMRRSDTVESHRGQVAFPGGRAESHDAGLLATALREANEEVGIAPASVDVLGRFADMSTVSTGMQVASFAGIIPPPDALRIDPVEVAEVFDVPMRVLADPGYRGRYKFGRDGRSGEYPAILYRGQTIWGLTLRITDLLLGIVNGAAVSK